MKLKVWLSGRLGFHRHYHFLNSYTGFQFLIELIFKLSTLTYRPLSTQQPSYLASLLHVSNIPKQLRSSISQQLIVPKTKLNLSKRAFSVAAHRVWNELPISLKTSETIHIFRKNSTCIYSKLHFHHKCSVVPRSDTDFCMSLFTRI